MQKSEQEINAEKTTKSMPHLIPPDSLLAVGHCMAYGFNKHGDCTWRVAGTEQAKPETHVASMLRHVLEHIADPTATEEGSGRAVLEHAVTQGLIALDCIRRRDAGRKIDTIYVDMDGVLVDMVRGCYRLWGCDPDVGHESTDGWDAMPGEVSRQLGRVITPAVFWDAVRTAGACFWAGLEPSEDCAAIIRLCEASGAHVEIMSTPTRDPFSAAGKIQWLQKHLPGYDRHFNLCTDKHTKARPGALLIDDGDHNIEAFKSAGGQVWTWAQPWNTHRGLENLAIEALAEFLK